MVSDYKNETENHSTRRNLVKVVLLKQFIIKINTLSNLLHIFHVTIINILFVLDLLYRQTVPINGTPVELEVIDVSGSNSDKFPTEQVNI